MSEVMGLTKSSENNMSALAGGKDWDCLYRLKVAMMRI